MWSISAENPTPGTPSNRKGRGRAKAAGELLPQVYDELRRLARRRMAREPAGQTLQPTALVHEAYLRLLGDADAAWENRAHFLAAAAEAMRRILVERARKYRRIKHGGGRERITLANVGADSDAPAADILALDEALTRLAAKDPRKSEVVHLRYFAGCTIEETAEVLGVSPATVKGDWSYAKAWLHRELSRS